MKFKLIEKINDFKTIMSEIVEEICSMSEDEVLSYLQDGLTDRIDSDAAMFIVSNGKVLNIDNLFNSQEHVHSELGSYLIQILLHIRYKDSEFIKNAIEEYHRLYDVYATNILTELTDNFNWIRINPGNTNTEKRFYAVFPYDRPMPAQYRKFEEFLERGIKENKQNVQVFIGDDGLDYHNYQLRTTSPEDIIKSIKGYYSYGELVEKLEDSLEEKSKKEFGTTRDFSEAGYILKDGTLLDFSEKSDGGRPHNRSLDHRAIARVYDKELDSQTAYLTDFMNRGNIRIDYFSASMDICKEPTEEQYKTLKEFIRKCILDREDFNLDISDERGNNIENRYYEGKNANSTRIINDIKTYFSTGRIPEISQLNNFR